MFLGIAVPLSKTHLSTRTQHPPKQQKNTEIMSQSMQATGRVRLASFSFRFRLGPDWNAMICSGKKSIIILVG